MGRCENGLYNMEDMDKKVAIMAVKIDYETWHKRLGHSSKLHQIESIGSVVNIENCDSCLRAKQTRLPFPNSNIKTSSCFELIHYDIWGGYKVPSLSGAHYFLTIVDDFSRSTWIYLIKNKSDVGKNLIAFYNMIQTQFGKGIKRIRSDNGGNSPLIS